MAAVRWGSCGVILGAALLRLMSIQARTPYWDVDPTRAPMPETAMLPSWLLGLDAAVWLASCAGVLACAWAGERVRWKSGLLVLLGCAGVVLRDVALDGRAFANLNNAFTSSAWAAAMVGAWALTHLARDAAIRRAATAVLAGACVMLAARGAHQVFIEHPRTVAMYRADSAASLIAQGIEPGSTSAKEFERRLMQPEASGWIGLSTASASIMGAGVSVLLAIAVGAWRAGKRSSDSRPVALPISSGHTGIVWLLTGVVGAGWLIAFSKGGTLAGLVGIVLVAFSLSRWSSLWGGRWAKWLGLGLPLLALAAVAVRGAIGERLGELSLLFRSQYLLGAMRVVQDHWLLGCGARGFKAAYVLHKAPTAVESIESPHSVFFDWTACLGILGAAWVVVLLAWAVRAGRALARQDGVKQQESSSAEESSSRFVWCVCVIGVATAMAWIVELAAVSADEWPLRLPALAGWGLLAWIVCRMGPRVDRCVAIGLGAASLVLVVHAQIEVTPVLTGSVAWFLCAIGLGAAGCEVPSTKRHPERPGVRVAVTLCGVGWVVLLAPAIARAARWEGQLRAASEIASPVGEARELLGQRAPLPEQVQTVRQLLALGANPSGAEVQAAMIAADLHVAAAGGERLVQAWRMEPSLPAPVEAAMRLHGVAAAELSAAGRTIEAEGALEPALKLAREVSSGPVPTTLLAACAGVFEASGELAGRPEPLLEAMLTWERIAAMDPGAMTPALKLANLNRRLGDAGQARKWAAKALELNGLLHLDPLKQLGEAARSELEAAVRGP